MFQKVVLASVSLLVLAAAFALFLVSGDETAPSAPDAPTAAAPDQPTAAAGSADGNTALEASAELDQPTAARDAVAATAENRRPLPDDAEWITITVVDEATQQPVSGAVVAWHDEEPWEYLQSRPDIEELQQESIWRDHERLCELAGWSTRTAADGTARVTLHPQTTVVGRDGARYGMLFVRRNTVMPPGGHRLVLKPDRTLQVQVLTASGEPALRVPIGLLPLDAEHRAQGPYGWWTLATTAGPDGIAVIPHIQLLQQEAVEQHEVDPTKVQWHARAMLPGNDDHGVPFAIDALPTEPLVLRLPPCGEIHVRATFGGRPLAGFDGAYLSENSEKHNRRFQSWRMARTGADGVARFEHMVLGCRYDVNTNAGGGMHRSVDGPIAAGQVVEVTLAHDDAALLVQGRILLPDRTPLVKKSLQLRARGPDIHNWSEVKTDTAGRFLVTVGNSQKDNRLDELFFEFQQKGLPPRRAEVTPRTLRAGIEDVGDLVLAEPKVLVGGMFMAGDKPYLRPLHVWVEREEAATEKRAARWRRIETQEFQHEGSFRIYAAPTPGRYRLAVHAGEALPPPPVEFRPGTEDLVVAIETGDPLAASVLLPEKSAVHYVRAVLVGGPPPERSVNPGKNQEPPTAMPQKQTGDRHDLQWPALRAGSYTLELRLWSVAEPLVRIHDVQVPAPAGGDPRLLDIDLRPLVRTARLTLLDVTGKQLDDASGMLFPTGQAPGSEWLGYQLHEAVTELLLPLGPIDMTAMVAGYRPQPVRGGGDRLEVRLDPWPVLDVAVANLPQLPPKTSLRITATPEQPTPIKWRAPWDSGQSDHFLAPSPDRVTFENGQAKVPVGDGQSQLRLTLQANRRSVEITGFEPRTVLSTAGQVVLQVTNEQWQRALEELAKPQPGKQPTPK